MRVQERAAGPEGRAIATVRGVADDGVPDGAEVDAQLVRASCLEATLDEAHDGCVVLRADFVGGARRPALVADRHAGAPRGASKRPQTRAR